MWLRIFFSGCAGMWERQLVRLGVIIVAWIFIICQLPTVGKRAERVSDSPSVWSCSSVRSCRAEEPAVPIDFMEMWWGERDYKKRCVRSARSGLFPAAGRSTHGRARLSYEWGRWQEARLLFWVSSLPPRQLPQTSVGKFATDSVAQTLHEFG